MKDYDLFLKAKELVRQGRKEEAMVIFEKLYAQDPNNSIIAGSYAKLLFQFKNGKEKGEQVLIQLLDSSKSKTFALVELGKYMVREHRNDEARQYFNQLLSGDKKAHNLGLLNLGWLESTLGNFDSALTYFQTLLFRYRQEKMRLEHYLNELDCEADDYYKNKEHLCQKLSNNSNQYLKVLKKMAFIYLDMRNHCQKSVQLDTYENQAYTMFQEIASNSKDLCDRSVALLRMGKIETKNELYEEAESHFKEILAISTSFKNDFKFQSSALLELGKLKMQLGSISEAREIFLKLLSREGKSMYALLELGKLEVSAGNYDRACEYFDEIVAHGSKKDQLYAQLELGRLCRRIGSIDRAKGYYEEIISECLLEGKNEQQQRFFDRSRNFSILELGMLEMEQGNFSEASSFFEQLSSENTVFLNQVFALKNLIYVTIRQHQYEKAYCLLEKLIDLNHLFNVKEFKQLDFYLRYQLGKITEDDVITSGYFEKQVLEYQSERTLLEIRKSVVEDGRSFSLLSSDIDLSQLFVDIQSRLLELTPTTYTLFDKYIVDMDFVVGTFSKEEVCQLEVLTLPDTKDILYVYPSKGVMIDYDLNSGRRKSKKLDYKNRL